MRHELVVDEAHDTTAEEYPWKVQTQQHLPHKNFIPATSQASRKRNRHRPSTSGTGLQAVAAVLP